MQSKQTIVWICIFFFCFFTIKTMEKEEVSSEFFSNNTQKKQEERLALLPPSLRELAIKVAAQNLANMSEQQVTTGLPTPCLNLLNHQLITPLPIALQESRPLDPEEHHVHSFRPLPGEKIVTMDARHNNLLLYQLLHKPTQEGAGEQLVTIESEEPVGWIRRIETNSEGVIYFWQRELSEQKGTLELIKVYQNSDEEWKMAYTKLENEQEGVVNLYEQVPIKQNELKQLYTTFIGKKYLLPYKVDKIYEVVHLFPKISKLFLCKNGFFEIVDTNSWHHIATLHHPQYISHAPTDVRICGTKILTLANLKVRVWDIGPLNALQKILLLRHAVSKQVFHCIREAKITLAKLYQQDEKLREANIKKQELLEKVMQLKIDDGLKKVLSQFIRLQECQVILGNKPKITFAQKEESDHSN